MSRPSDKNTTARTARGFSLRDEKRLEAVMMLSHTRDDPESKPLCEKRSTLCSRACRSVVSPDKTLGAAFLSWNSTTPMRCAAGNTASAESNAPSMAWMPLLPSASRAADMLFVKSNTNTTSKSMFSAVCTKKLVSA